MAANALDVDPYLLSLLDAVVFCWALRQQGFRIERRFAFSSGILERGVEVEGIVSLVEGHTDEPVTTVGILYPKDEVSAGIDAAIHCAVLDGTDGEDGAVPPIHKQHDSEIPSLHDFNGALPHFIRPVRTPPAACGLAWWEFEDVRILDLASDPLYDLSVLERFHVGGSVVRDPRILGSDLLPFRSLRL